MNALPTPSNSLFGLDNLPFAVFSVSDQPARVGVRIGDSVVDLAMALSDDTFACPSLNPFMAQGPGRWAEVRSAITTTATDLPAEAVHRLQDVVLHQPFQVADYVDFYASEYHATNLGRLLRPGSEPLLPNWKHLPVGYHGRAGTVVVSGTRIVRPRGQRKPAGETAPQVGPSQWLDIEAEIGFVVGVGSVAGESIKVSEFADHVFGVVLVNDWSARDIQAWEYQPLGPHLGKSFATSISPWVVPLAALQAARVPTPDQNPEPVSYLRQAEPWGLDIELVVRWNGVEVSRPPYRHMYWSPAQMLAHMTFNGARARTGDLFASGTVSGPGAGERGSLFELTWGGSEPIKVNGQRRGALEDGDEVVITATAPGASGGRIGFGEVRGTIQSARRA